ncbi:DUF485 domain-containing protein [Arthrobacter roseus]|uniref:DUF485 domain-containing protein n=1 Tax=Arthrobacter roseus TaxID=136274 RepID=UPI001964E8B8|nr:DUF485 domain-containing protein [Arthrobacter roseus]MBM7848184.1 uncharacterized membrane protein (DUF485 family) [Arthrobacter roseus]
MSHPPPEPEAVISTDFRDVQEGPEFRELRRRHRSFVFPLAAAFLLWYFLYVLLADYAHEFMSTPVVGNINIGIVLGLLQFVSTFGITMWYVSYANRRLDPVATKIREELESEVEDK